jgi:hypothetical protein
MRWLALVCLLTHLLVYAVVADGDPSCFIQSAVRTDPVSLGNSFNIDHAGSSEGRSSGVIAEQKGMSAQDAPAVDYGVTPHSCPAIHTVVPTVILSIVMLVAILFLAKAGGQGETAEAARCAGLYQQFCGVCNYSVVIVESYRLSKALGHSASFSGQLIGIYMFAAAFGGSIMAIVLKIVPDVWKQRPREALILAQILNIVGFSLYTWVTSTVTYEAISTWTEAKHLTVAIMVARAMSGIGHGFCAQLLQVSFAHLTPLEHRPSQMARFFFVNTLGIGLGPMLAATMRVLDFCPKNTPPRFELAGVSQLVLAVGALMAVSLFYPRLQDVEDFVKTENDMARAYTPRGTPRGAALQKIIVIGCILATCIRACVTSGVEGATSLLLEVDYEWDPESIGVVIGAAFLCCFPAKTFIDIFYHHLTPFQWIQALCSISLVGALLLFRHTWPTLIMADVLLFPSLYLSDGMVRGLMQQYALPSGSYFDQNHTTLWAMLLNSSGRYFGPWMGRFLLDKASQTAYASLQVLLTISFWIIFEAMVVRPARAPELKLDKDDTVVKDDDRRP